MVTVTFVAMFISILILISGIDMFILQQPLWVNFIRLFSLDQGTNEWYINVAAATGFIISIVIDYRIRKNKRAKQS